MCSLLPKLSAKCSQVVDMGSDMESIDEKVNQTIDCHMFCRNIQLISRNSDLIDLMKDYIQSTETLGYYLVKNIPIYVFIDKILINGFVKTGKLYCLSINKEIDFDDSFALLPNGLLILSVKESTYHRIGLIGKKSILFRNKNCVKKYFIEIDLNCDHLRPGTKFYKRTEECLQRSGLSFDVFIKWEVNEELSKQEISSMSIKNFFSYLKFNSNDKSLESIQWFRCSPALRKFVNNDVPIPLISEELVVEDMESLIEWFGAQVCQIDCDLTEDTDVSTFGLADTKTRDDISCVSLSGFFISSDIRRIVNKLKERILKSGVNAIVVNGFEETPIAWMGSKNEHSKQLSGENVYGIGCGQGLAFIWRIADEFDFGIERL